MFRANPNPVRTTPEAVATLSAKPNVKSRCLWSTVLNSVYNIEFSMLTYVQNDTNCGCRDARSTNIGR